MVKILSWTGSTLFDSDKPTLKESLQDAVLQDAVLRGAVLRDADLRGADLQDAKMTLEPYFQLCARDILYVFQYCKSEVPALRHLRKRTVVSPRARLQVHLEAAGAT